MKKNKFKNILVTGAAGFIGSHLCDCLLERGHKVIGLVYGEEKNIKHLKNNKNFKKVRCDISDFKKLIKIFKKHKPELIFHTAAFIPKSEKEDYYKIFKTNVIGTINILEAAHLENIGRIIYSSSMSAYGGNVKKLPVTEIHPTNPDNFYGLSKWQAEEISRFYNREHKIKIVILRYSGVFGPRRKDGAFAKFIFNALNNKPLEILGDIKWDVVFVKDVVLANILAMEKIDDLGFETFNIGHGKEIDIKELAKKIIKITNSKSKIKIKNNNNNYRFYYDISKAKKMLNFNPLSLDSGLREYFKEILKT